MFFSADLPVGSVPPAPALPRVLRARRWMQRLRLRVRRFLGVSRGHTHKARAKSA